MSASYLCLSPARKRLNVTGVTPKRDAGSAAHAFAAPAAAGVLSVLYCAGNAVQDAEPITVMIGEDDDAWIIFTPAGLDGPMVLERSSVGALAARVAVTTAARLQQTAG